ncbi:MAG: hypothetical protein ACXWWC_13090 [Chitinophagaceae bacterium]
MKKWFIVIISLSLLFLFIAYYIIPAKILVTKSITANANQTGVYRFLNDESNWQKWWPGKIPGNTRTDTLLEEDGFSFKINKILYNAFDISITKGKNTDSSVLFIFSPVKDSIRIEWNTTINTGTNPFRKVSRYFKARDLSKTLDAVLTAMQKHVGNVHHIYGTDIRKEKVKIEFLVSTTNRFDHYPDTEDIYELVGKIKKHINTMQLTEEDHPMLNIKKTDSTHFEAQVAIPVDKKIEETNDFFIKRMLKNGDILVTEITGGKNKIDSAMKQMETYALDHQYNNIAIPFQSLVTDRMKVADSAKWVTKIYYPVM